MFFYHKKDHYTDYLGDRSSYKAVTEESFLAALCDAVDSKSDKFDTESYHFFMSTEVKKGFFCGTESVLVLDCDDDTSFYAAERWLRTKGISYRYIKSGPNSYWVICDYVDKTRKVLKMLNLITGVDPDFKKGSLKQGRMLLRASPKYSSLYPHFPYVNTTFDNDVADKFWRQLLFYWENREEIKYVKNRLFPVAKPLDGIIFFALNDHL